MTYGFAIKVAFVAHEEHEAISHGLTSSPPREGRGKKRATPRDGT